MDFKKSVTIPYGVILYLYWTGFAVLSPFASAYLLSAGFSNSAIGGILSGSAFLAAIVQPSVGSAIDRSKRIFNSHLMMFVSAVMAVLGLGMWLFRNGSGLLLASLFACNYILLYLVQPFGNAMGMDYMNAGYKLNFGLARAVGSLGYAICAYVLGKIIEGYGVHAISLALLLAFGGTAVLLLFAMPKLNKEDCLGDNNITDQLSPIAFLKKYPKFGVLICGLVCIYFTHTLINTYALQILQVKGGNEANVGTAASIAAVLELIPMIGFPLLVKKFRYNTLIRVAGSFFIVKIVATLLAPNVLWFYFSQIFQIGGWGIMAIAIVYYVNEIIEKENASQGQAYSGVSMTMGTVSAALICGRLLDVIGVQGTLLAGIIIGSIGLALVFLTTGAKEEQMV